MEVSMWTSMLASRLPPSFLDNIICLYHLWDVRPYALSWVFLFSEAFAGVLPSSTSRMVSSILWGGQPRCLSLWCDFCNIVWFWVVFSFSCGILFNFFFDSSLFDGICFSDRSYFSWFGRSISSVICRFLFFIISTAHFSMPDSIPVSSLYIHTACIHQHPHVVPLARISLTLSRHFSLSFIAFGRSSVLHPVSSHSCWMYVRAGRLAFARPYVGVHKSTSLMSSSLLL